MRRRDLDPVTATMLDAQEAAVRWRNLSWSRRMLLKMIGGDFTRAAVSAGVNAQDAEAEQRRTLRMPGPRLSDMVGAGR